MDTKIKAYREVSMSMELIVTDEMMEAVILT